MRLLHTQHLTFAEFFDERRPPYAILSHRWTDEEVSHKQYVDGNYSEGPGMDKIRNACGTALQQGLDWLWVDTICIDKSSSAELSEAINSMWRWYSNAAVCLAYLADVAPHKNEAVVLEAFSRSQWFTRGWTLQELLAPQWILFLDSEWDFIGPKSHKYYTGKYHKYYTDAVVNHNDYPEMDHSIAVLIEQTTHIDRDFLTKKRKLSEASVAMRMSWASKRVTTRLEDQAYCLLGLFDVNMPLLYGEGSDAFFRLQLEILRSTDDESLFAWRANEALRGFLATSPAEFEKSGNIHKMELGPEQRLPWAWTNKGLELRILDRVPLHNSDPMPAGNHEQVVYLGCYMKGSPANKADLCSPALQVMHAQNDSTESAGNSYLAVTIRRFGNSWYRMRCAGFYLDTGFQSISKSMKTQLVYKYYYVPRFPSAAARSEYETWTGTGSATLHVERMMTKDEKKERQALQSTDTDHG